MNILNPNLRHYMPKILEAFSEVYGKKYEELIRTREKEIIYTMYIDSKEVLEYYFF